MQRKEDITVAMNEDSLVSLVKLPDRFKLHGLIGQGGMGYVFKAHDQLLQREVAIKILLYEGARLEQEQARFLQEAKILSNLHNDNIVSVLFSDLTESGDPYYVMELLEGESLAKEIEQNSPLKPERLYEIFSQVLEGLSCAHQSRIVHRDLKPTNIMLSKLEDGSTRVKLIDFGIARSMPEEGPSADSTLTLTRTNTIVGSPVYMSPEQCRGAKVDHLTDIYSLGCILFECITGRIVFQKDSAFQIMYAQMNEEPVSLESIAKSDGARSLGRLVDLCLRKNPLERPQSAEEIKKELNEIYLQHTAEMGTFGVKKLNVKKNGKPLAVKEMLAGLLILGILMSSVYLQKYRENELKRKELDKALQAHQKKVDDALKVKMSNLRGEIDGMHQQNVGTEKQILSAANADEKFTLQKELMDRTGRLTQADTSVGDYEGAVKDLSRTIEFLKKNMLDEPVGKTWLAGLIIARADNQLQLGNIAETEKDLEEAQKLDIHGSTAWGLLLNRMRLHIAEKRLDLVEPDLHKMVVEWQSGHSEYKIWASKVFGTPMSLSDALMEIYKRAEKVPAEAPSERLIKAKLIIAVADNISRQEDATKADLVEAQKCLAEAEPMLDGVPGSEFYKDQLKAIRRHCKSSF